MQSSSSVAAGPRLHDIQSPRLSCGLSRSMSCARGRGASTVVLTQPFAGKDAPTNASAPHVEDKGAPPSTLGCRVRASECGTPALFQSALLSFFPLHPHLPLSTSIIFRRHWPGRRTLNLSSSSPLLPAPPSLDAVVLMLRPSRSMCRWLCLASGANPRWRSVTSPLSVGGRIERQFGCK